MACIGVAAPGPLDPASGIVYEVPNMPGWHDFPLAARLVEATGLPVWVHNDANLAALAEARYGAGRGFDPLVYLTVSTGVGGGVIIDDEMLSGRHGLAGELGHVVVRAGGPTCGLGHPGCLEALASGTAIARRARDLVAAGRAAGIARFAAPDQPVSAATVAHAARSGDSVAIELYHDVGEVLGLAIGSLINIFDPGRVIIGGGVSQAWDLFAGAMWPAVRQVAMVWEVRPIDIVQALLADDAGLVGAASYALDRWEGGG
jgi:glucokinase